jgi:hypothetical protein
MIRALYLVKYPQGISEEAVERFFLDVHMREQRAVPGLRRYVSYRNLLGPGDHAMPGERYDRMIELWFDDAQSYKRYRAGGHQFTMAPWAPPGASGSGTFAGLASIMVSEEPEWNLGEMP